MEPTSDANSSNIQFPPASSSTDHSLDVASGTINYSAIGEWTTLRRLHEPSAYMFHTAYLATDANGQTDSNRPITFVFNGGPGAASAYLHMGALGPKRVAFGNDGSIPKPPASIVPNEESWLAFTDLVFIDPIGTGFSRALKPEQKEDKPKTNGDDASKESPEFWEVDKDIDSLGEFIQRFLSKHHRWTSPVFIAGESYGGFRVAKMARHLQESRGVGLCGALLISPAIEFAPLIPSDYNLAHWLERLPSYAATAFQHGRTKAASLESLVQEAIEFAQGDLLRWLSMGASMPDDERAPIVARAAAMMGVPEDFMLENGGRILARRFCRELLRDEKKFCGLYDSSVTTNDPFPDRIDYEGPDPTLFSIDRLFSTAINHQLRENLLVDTELDYRLLSMNVNRSWKNAAQKHYVANAVGAMDDLRYGMSLNEDMKVHISHGYFDLVTPFFSSQRLTQLMKPNEVQRENLVLENYKGGHMFYSWDSSRQAFTGSVKKFYANAN